MGHWDPLLGQQVCGRPWHCPQSAPLPWDTLAQHVKTLPLDLQRHRTTAWPHILGMGFLDLKLALATLIFVCLKGSQRNYHSKNCMALLHGLCCLQKWEFSLGWQSHTDPLCKSSFLTETNYWKSNLVLFYPLSHLQSRTFLPPVHLRCSFICFDKEHVCTRVHTHMYIQPHVVHVLEPHAHASAAKVVLSFYLTGYDKDKL